MSAQDATVTRRRILAAARGVLAADARAPVAAVATAAGLSRATVHRYFRTRADLLAAVDLEPDPDARARVLAAAAELIASHGLAALSMDELAAQSVKSAHLPLSQSCIMLPLQRVWPLEHSVAGATHAPSWHTAPFAHMSVDHLPPSVQNWTTFVASGWQRVSPAVHSGAGACRHCPFRQNSSEAQRLFAYHLPFGSHSR